MSNSSIRYKPSIHSSSLDCYFSRWMTRNSLLSTNHSSLASSNLNSLNFRICRILLFIFSCTKRNRAIFSIPPFIFSSLTGYFCYFQIQNKLPPFKTWQGNHVLFLTEFDFHPTVSFFSAHLTLSSLLLHAVLSCLGARLVCKAHTSASILCLCLLYW